MYTSVYLLLTFFAGEDSEEFENVTITFKQPLDNGK